MKTKLYTIYKNQLKWCEDLNKRTRTMRLLEENRRGNRLSVESGNDFLDMTPKVKQKKKKRMLINWTSAKFKVLVKGYKSKK